MAGSGKTAAGGGRFFAWWMLAFLGFPLGGLLALVLVGSVDGAVSGALGGALAGAVIGTAQWLALRRRLRVGPEWILATAVGVAAMVVAMVGALAATGVILAAHAGHVSRFPQVIAIVSGAMVTVISSSWVRPEPEIVIVRFRIPGHVASGWWFPA